MNNKIRNESNDREYYTVTPRLVWALSRDPYDYTLWGVIKDIAGEDGECYISTPELAKLSMMSTGKAQECRKYLIGAGLIEGKIERDHGYTQSVWHLKVVDIWAESIAWAKSHKSIKSRLDFKEELKRSCGESNLSGGDESGTPQNLGGLPGETKNIPEEHPKEVIASQKVDDGGLQTELDAQKQEPRRSAEESLKSLARTVADPTIGTRESVSSPKADADNQIKAYSKTFGLILESTWIKEHDVAAKQMINSKWYKDNRAMVDKRLSAYRGEDGKQFRKPGQVVFYILTQLQRDIGNGVSTLSQDEQDDQIKRKLMAR